jgi:hypothetical protein
MVSRLPGCLGNAVRKIKRNRSPKGRDRVSGNEEAYLEIQNFIKALNSYPACFARTPGVSFDQHQSGLAAIKSNESSRAKQNDCDVRRS